MKLASITPPGLIKPWHDWPWGYSLILGQHLVNNSVFEAQVIDWRRQGRYIMVDNGAAEAYKVLSDGFALPDERVPSFGKLLEVAEAVGYDEIVLPDKLLDGRYTIDNTLEWAKYVPDCKRAIVPQGKDWGEWEHCLLELNEKVNFRTICISKAYETFSGGRLRALEFIEERNLYRRYDVHLFGIKYSPMREIRSVVERYPWVRGIDTALPSAMAQQGLTMAPDGRFSYDWKGRLPMPELVIANTSILNAWCQGDFNAR